MVESWCKRLRVVGDCRRCPRCRSHSECYIEHGNASFVFSFRAQFNAGMKAVEMREEWFVEIIVDMGGCGCGAGGGVGLVVSSAFLSQKRMAPSA